MLTVDAPGAPAASAQPISYRRWPLSLAIVITGIFMTILDVTIVNVAVPAMQREFGGSLEDVLWVATAYTLTLGVCIPLSSWLGDRIGVTKLYIYALLGFAACSALCGIAWSLETLVFFRVLQAIPGGICPVLAMTLCYRLVPPKFAGVAMGAYGLGGVSAPAVGPVLGGWLVEHISWRMVFLINVPVGVIAGVLAIFVVPRILPVRVPRFDFAGFVTIAAAMASLLLAASKGESWGWDSYPILMLMVGGVLCLALFVVVELQVEHPLLEIRLLGDIQFSVSVIVAAMNFVNLMVTVFYIPVFLQQAQGKGALDAGLLMVPLALVMVVFVPLSGVLTPKLGPRLLGVVGICIVAWSDLLGTQITPAMTQEQTIGWTCLRALGLGIATVPLMVCGLNRFAAAKTNQASAISNVAQQLGAALALAGLGALITGQQAQHWADRTALLQPDSELARGASAMLAQPEAISDTVMAQFLHLGMILRIDTMASAYSDLFWVMALATAAYMWTPLLMSESSRFPLGTAPPSAPKPARERVVERPEPTRAPVPALTPEAAGRHRRREPVPVTAAGAPDSPAGRHRRSLRIPVPRPPVRKDRTGPGRDRVPQLGEWVLTRISDGARSAGRLPEYASTKLRDLPEYASSKIRDVLK
jgi:EmrB/QacA subfamily drug resistance transporter